MDPQKCLIMPEVLGKQKIAQYKTTSIPPPFKISFYV